MSPLTFVLICIQAFLVQNALSQCCSGPQINLGSFDLGGLGYGGYSNHGINSMVGQNIGNSIGSYGGQGQGNVGVVGELPVAGTTCVAGTVPVIGTVHYYGEVPAAGCVTIAADCCGCGGGSGFN